MAEAPAGVDDHVYLDATAIGSRFTERFPFITKACNAIGIDPLTQRIPVAPAAHYTCGGISSNLDGTTEVEGLFAVGEVAYTGVHGANRLASNSLTESLVVGTRVGRNLAWKLPRRVEPSNHGGGTSSRLGLLDDSLRPAVRTAMSRHVGVLRSPDGLQRVIDDLAAVAEKIDTHVPPTRRNFEATNILTVATAVAMSALARTESRGCHRRPIPRIRVRNGCVIWVCRCPTVNSPSTESRQAHSSTMQYHPLSDGIARQLVAAGLQVDVVRRVIAVGLDEDLAHGPDITTLATVPADQRSTGTFGARASGCIAGIDIAAAVLDMVCGADSVTFTKQVNDGQRCKRAQYWRTLMHPRGMLTRANR